MKTQSALINPVKLPDDLNEAERHFVKCIAMGKPCIFGTTRPKPDNKSAPVIRAGVIGFFVWGGSEENPILGNRIYLEGAQVRGVLNLDYRLSPYMLVMAHCHFNGEIKMAHSGFRYLNLSGSHLTSGLTGTGIQITSDLVMADGFSSDRAVVLLDANIGGGIFCHRGAFTQDERDAALIADRAKVGGNVSLVDDFSAKGCVRFLGANIGGYFACDNGKFFKSKEGWALAADGIKIENELFMGNGFWAEGLVRFPGARINGGVDGSKGEFGGMVSFEGAKIGGDLSFEGSVFRNNNGLALSADTTKIGGNVHLHGKFFSAGEVRFLSADIGGSLSCLGGTFQQGFTAGGAKIKDRVIWRETKGAGIVNFADASAEIFSDDECRKAFDFILRGFVYSQFHDPADVKSRIAWLARRPATVPFSPQPFEQAANALFAAGQDIDAREILLEKEKQLTKHGDMSVALRFWRRLWDLFAGYGYRLRKTLAWAAMFVVWGMVIFKYADHSCRIFPHQPLVTVQDKYAKEKVEHCAVERLPTRVVEENFPEYPEFNALAYSLDVFIPFFALHQESHWYPQVQKGDGFWLFYFLRFWFWLEVIAGWLLTSLAVLSITGLLRPRQSSGDKE